MLTGNRWLRLLWVGSAGMIALLLAGPCLATLVVYDTLYFQHQRAYQQWSARKPTHYRYTITIQKPWLSSHWDVEVVNGKVTRQVGSANNPELDQYSVSQASTISPLVVTSDSNWIEVVFKAIDRATTTAASPVELFARHDPNRYSELVYKYDWLKGGWDTCQPPFPKVVYDPVYSFPAEATLHGLPCIASIDLGSAASVRIFHFEVLP